MNIMRRLPRSFWGGVALVVASSALVAGLQMYQVQVRAAQLLASRIAVDHTFDVIGEIVALNSALQDAERGQRGYLLTARQDYLAPYEKGIEEAPMRLGRLKSLTADNPEQQRRWPLVEQQIKIKFDEMNSAIEARRNQGLEAAARIVETDVGLNSMAAITGNINAALAAENALLTERVATFSDEHRRISRIALLTSIVGLLGIFGGLAFATLAARHILDTHDALALAKAQLAQAQKLEALGQLTGGIAHDFNNLLQGITGGIALLRKRFPKESGDASDWIDMISRNATRAARLTQRLLAFSRRQPLNPKPLDFNKVVTDATVILRESIGENIAVETVLSGGLWQAEADAPELETAILNLAINARDAMPSGGKLTLETSNAFLDERYCAQEGITSGQYVMVAVTDTGLGMNPETAQKAFEPFFTTKDIGKGTGLGLSQVYGFVKQSTGHVKIYSEMGQGTTVKMYFPRVMNAGEDTAGQDVPPPRLSASSHSILVVEDDADVRAFTATILAENGFRVATAHDADSALQVLEREPATELLLTDVGLPGARNGKLLADEARTRWPKLRVVFMTGYARNAIIHGGRLDPGVDLIVKPFSENALLEKLHRVLDALGAPDTTARR
ncbi:MAG: CHASE3 domain-containing protein [Rhodospirillaceae bacterium]